MQWVPSLLLLCCTCTLVQVITVGTLFLERGHRGIVPCPLSKSCNVLVGDVDAMYWRYGSKSDTAILISYFLGRVAPQNGIPEGVYDIDEECNLIIENVTASNEGTYYYMLKPHLKSMREGQIEACDKVSPSRPYPTVIGCNQDHDADTCEVRVRPNSTVHNLTCVMEQVKPAVELRWILGGGLTELNASTTVRPVVLPAYLGSSLWNNTYSTSASIQVPSESDGMEYVCEAIGVAVGSSTARTRVHLTKTAIYNEGLGADGTVFLERGQRGAVPCPLIKSRQIPPENVDAIYWYYGSTSDTSLLISYFRGRVAPQNGIPEGVYDIDDEFNLIIENVTASNEGTYFFKLKPHLKMIQEGKVEVCDKVSPNPPYPTVIGFNQDHYDADTREVRLYYSATHMYNLTCVMEQVKPAVELRWIRLFLGGLTVLNASSAVRLVVLPAHTVSSLRNNTYSTSASVQVTAFGDEEVYVCEAVGVVVDRGAYITIRITRTHPTTATHDDVYSSNNPGTTLLLADGVSPISEDIFQRVFVIVISVVVSVLAVCVFGLCVHCVWKRSYSPVQKTDINC